MQGIQKRIQKNTKPIEKALDPEIAHLFTDSDIYVYSTARNPLIPKASTRDQYNIREVISRILKHKGGNFQQQQNPCNLLLCLQKWKDIHAVVGTEGIVQLFQMYTVLEKKGNSFISYFSGEIDIIVKEDEKRTQQMVKLVKIKNLNEIKIENIYSTIPNIYLEEIQKMIENVKTVNTHGIVSSFIRMKSKSEERKSGTSKYEISLETVVRLLYIIVKKVFFNTIPDSGMVLIKRKIRWFLVNKNGPMKFADLHCGLKTNFKSKIKNNDPLTYKKYIIETVNFIFTTYIPYLLGVHIKDNGKTAELIRFFLRDGVMNILREFKKGYIEKYFEKVPASDVKMDNVYSIGAIPKKNTFRSVFKNLYVEDDLVSPFKSILYEKMICNILTREANERVKWENALVKHGRPPRTRSYNSIFRTIDLGPRLELIKKEFHSNFLEKKPLYILLLDIQNCFDNISLDKLNALGLVRSLLGKKEYEVYRWKHITEGRSKTHRRTVAYPSEFPNKVNMIYHNLPGRVHRIFKSCAIFTQSEIEEVIEKSINRSILKYEGNYYRRVKGINQGCRFASHLCAYYLAALDKHVYADLNETRAIRYVDDSLIISWSLEELNTVVKRLVEMEQSTGVVLNLSKCKLYTTSEKIKPVTILGVIESEYKKNFKWCGMHLDSESLHLQMHWDSKKQQQPPIHSKTALYQRILYNINSRLFLDLFHLDNPKRHANIRLFIRCQVEKTLQIFDNPGNAHLKDSGMKCLFDIIMRLFRSKEIATAEEIRKAFRTAVYLSRRENPVMK